MELQGKDKVYECIILSHHPSLTRTGFSLCVPEQSSCKDCSSPLEVRPYRDIRAGLQIMTDPCREGQRLAL